MSRLVDAKVRGAARFASGADGLKEYLERVAKYVPSEVIASYMFLNGLVGASNNAGTRLWLFGILFLAGLVVTPIYLSNMADAEQPKKVHLVLATIAYGIWTYYLGGIFSELHLYQPLVASFLVVLFSMISGVFVPRK